MRYVIVALLVCSLTCPSFGQDPGWPREKSNADGSIVYYQPQLDEWTNFKQLKARMAVSIRPKVGQPTVGVIYLQAATDANTDTRNVLLSNVQITETKFPSLDAAASAAMDKLVRTFLMPGASINISLDRLLADIEVLKNPPSLRCRSQKRSAKNIRKLPKFDSAAGGRRAGPRSHRKKQSRIRGEYQLGIVFRQVDIRILSA